MPRDWKLRIEDILESIRKIQRYTNGISFVDFANDEMRIDAVVRNIGIIGEAANNIPLEIQDCYPQLPWFEMRGIRNVVIHEYFGLSLIILWQTAKDDLPPLIKELEAILGQG